MNILLAGPGRAGMSVALAFRGAGHAIGGVLGRASAAAAAAQLDSVSLSWDELLPAADLLVIGVRDDALSDVARRLAPQAIGIGSVVHLSGAVSVQVLGPFADVGVDIGGFHPLQTLPDPSTGARRLPGAWAGITADSPSLHAALSGLAHSIGMVPFDLPDHVRPLYHAGGVAAANYLVGSLAVARRLFEAAGVPWEAARPLVDAVIDNTFELGPAAALTGPIARGDVSTVERQLAAVRAAVPGAEEDFADLGRVVARLAGRAEEFRSVLG